MNTLLDVRGLEPPEPMQRILDALDGLPDGGRLEALLDREPYPLYRILARDGYAYAARWQLDACVVVIGRVA
jgi:uncharacterized protein (DUF2249 family)